MFFRPREKGRPAPRPLRLAAFCALALCALARAQAVDVRGVVLDRTADLRSGPAAREQVIATVHAGAEVDVKGRSGDWIQVRAGENLEGWLPATAVGVVQDGF